MQRSAPRLPDIDVSGIDDDAELILRRIVPEPKTPKTLTRPEYQEEQR